MQVVFQPRGSRQESRPHESNHAAGENFLAAYGLVLGKRSVFKIHWIFRRGSVEKVIM